MKAKMEIDCESIGDLTSHLYETIRQIKKEAKKQKVCPTEEFPAVVRLEDDNCYGSHEIEIFPEDYTPSPINNTPDGK